MSNIANIVSQISKLSSQLAAARAKGDEDLVDQLTDELNDLEDELEDAEDAAREGGGNWFQN